MFPIIAQNIILSTAVPKTFPVRSCFLRCIIFIGDLSYFQRLHLKYQTSNQKLKKNNPTKKICTMPKLLEKISAALNPQKKDLT